MPSRFKEGDYVRIITREATAADIRNKVFFPYCCGLAGTIDKVYDTDVCLNVDLETLSPDTLARHKSVQETIKRKWLDGLSGEARNRLTADEKKFELAYTLIVQISDIEKAAPSEVKKPAANNSKAVDADEAPMKSVTSKDLDNAEKQFIEERKKAAKSE
jgi:hypothetical protein